MMVYVPCLQFPLFCNFAGMHGGVLESETEAQFIFSDNAFAADTRRYFPRALSPLPLPTPALHRVNEEQRVCVFLSCWVSEVLRMRCHVADLPVGRFCLLPHTDIQDHAHKGSVSLVGAGRASRESVEVREGGEGPGTKLSLDPWRLVEELRENTRVEG